MSFTHDNQSHNANAYMAQSPQTPMPETPRESYLRVHESSTSSSRFTVEQPEVISAYDLPVDERQFDRATALKPWSFQRPHMRAFHLSYLSGLPGFIGWYAIPPLMPIIKEQLNLTDGQVLNSDIAATASTIITRIIAGPLLDRYGPKHIQSFLLWIGAIPIAGAAFVSSSIGLLIARFVIGFVGCIFVSCQYWTTIMFARNVAGTSNAITGGIGLAGIGFAFLILPYLEELFELGMSQDIAWRLTIAVPAIVMVIMGIVIWFHVDSCPMGPFENLIQAKKDADHPEFGIFRSFAMVLTDPNTIILTIHYAVTFGAELQLNNMGALYFYEEFPKDGCTGDEDECAMLSKTQAASLASIFGLMNLVARALGGLASDKANARFGMKGRLAVQFVLLIILGVVLIILSRNNGLAVCAVLYVLVAVFAQAAGGSAFGMVPYVSEHLTGPVTGIVGAGGNVGGVIYGIIFRGTGSRQNGLLIIGIIALASSLTTPLLFLKRKKTGAA